MFCFHYSFYLLPFPPCFHAFYWVGSYAFYFCSYSSYLQFLIASLMKESKINQYLCLHPGQNKDFKCLITSPIYQVFFSSILFPPYFFNSPQSSQKYVSFFWPHYIACRIVSGIESVPLAVKAQSPDHWTAKESPQICLFIFKTTYSEIYGFFGV